MIWLDNWNLRLFRCKRDIFVRKEMQLRTKYGFHPVVVDGSAWWCRETVQQWIPVLIVGGNFSRN